MDHIVVDRSVGSKFQAALQPVEVLDETGRTLGHFVPSQAITAPHDCPYSAEELQRMQGEEGGRPLAEIWKSLGAK